MAKNIDKRVIDTGTGDVQASRSSKKQGGNAAPSPIVASRPPLGSDYVSPILAAVHETAAGLYDSGLLDKVTMREFDVSCLMPVAEREPREIRDLRNREGVSQAVFARYLGVAINTLGQWERGLRKPDGPALRLLSLIERHGLEYVR